MTFWPSKKGRTKEEKFLAHEEESQAHFQKPEVRDALKRNDWNSYKITCKGNSIKIEVNGGKPKSIQVSNVYLPTLAKLTEQMDSFAPRGRRLQYNANDFKNKRN